MYLKLLTMWFLLLFVVGCKAAPLPPQSTGTGPPRAARTVRVNNASELQPALDAAAPGDTIELVAGATYTGNFRIPAKADNRKEFITIQSTAVDKLPAGGRVSPQSSAHMARLVTTNADPLLLVSQRAHNWRIIGLELTTAPGVYAYDIIRVGDMEATSADAQPRDIELDRVYVHAHPDKGTKRGIFFNSNAVKLTNSYLSEFKSNFQDAMAVAVCNGPGPYEITNNYLEGAGYGIIIGGCPNGIPGIVPSDITFTRNHVFKPLAWKDKWVVKNIFEVKLGRRIRIEGNVFENNWVANQSGFGILFTVRTDGVDTQGKPFGIIEDVTFANNMVINSTHGINILGQDEARQNIGQGKGFIFRNNLFVKVPGRLFQFLQNPKDILIENNTSVSNGAIIMSENVTTGMVMRDNLFTLGDLGIFGSGLGSGNKVLQVNFPGSVVQFNGFVGEGESWHPGGNTYLKKVEEVRFVDPSQGNYRLQPKSPLRGKGQKKKDPGVDMDSLEAAVKGVAAASEPSKIAAELYINGTVQPIEKVSALRQPARPLVESN